MKILLATEYPENPDEIPGGVSAVAVNLVQSMGRLDGHEIHVLTRTYKNNSDRTERHQNATIHFFSTPRPKLGTRVFREIPKVTRLVREINPDIVHAHLTDYAYPCLKMGIPTVWTPHGVTSHQVQGWGNWKGRFRGLMYGWLEAEALFMARHIISITPFIEASFSMKTKALFHAIENPIHDDFFGIGAGAVPGRLLFVGTIHPRKGLDILLESFARVFEKSPQSTLHIVGPGSDLDPSFEKRMRDTVRQKGLDLAVSFLGMRTGRHLVAEYEQAEIVTLPSRVDTAPTAISEAMAAGRPVVATTVGGVPWMLRDGQTGFLVASGDTDSLTNRILALLDHPDLRREVGARARKEAGKRFSSKEVTHKTLEVYEEAVGKVSRRASSNVKGGSDQGYWDRVWLGTGYDPYIIKRERTSKRFRILSEFLLETMGDWTGLKVVEIGSGLGYNAFLMARKGARATLIDADLTALRKAKQFFSSELGVSPDLICGDVFHLSQILAERFDVVMSFGFAEHFQGERRRQVLEAHVQMARPGGVIAISVPHRHAPLYRAQKFTVKQLRRWETGYRFFSKSGTIHSSPEFPFSRSEMAAFFRDLPVDSCSVQGVAFLEPVDDFLKLFRYPMEKFQFDSVASLLSLPDVPIPGLDRLFGKHLLLLARKQEARTTS